MILTYVKTRATKLMRRTAAKACIACRDRKRKCDRIRPSCSLCYRLGRTCRYEGRGQPPASEKSIIKLTFSQTNVPSVQRVSSLTPLESGQFLQDINVAVTENMSRAIGDLSEVSKVATRYFGSVHLWFPILSDTSYHERLPNIFSQPCAKFSLLTLSLALITTIPAETESWESFRPLYMLVKSSIAVVEAANLHSLEIVQARLLVALFETGHDIEPAAYISIASTARAAAAFGLNQEPDSHPDDWVACRRHEERSRVWWGIVMLDRNYTLERGEGICVTQDLGSPRFLPRDDSAWDHKILCSAEPLPLSTPSSVRVGPFARQAQVSHLLSILLTHLREGKLNNEFDREESDQIARTLTAFLMLLPEATPQPWPRYCGALGMCYNAFMTLHESRSPLSSAEEVSRSDTPESKLSALKRLNRISTKFNEKIDQVDFEAISPFPPQGLAKACLTQYRLWRDTEEETCLRAAESLMIMINHFSKRWMKAAKLLRQLKMECASHTTCP